jgi:hypothetical protein
MESQKTCCDIENHHHHMCSRLNTTVVPEVESLSYSPTVKCGICGALAASVNDVCTPVKIWEEAQLT